MSIFFSCTSTRSIAVAKSVAVASADWDDGQFSMFEEAVAYATFALADSIIWQLDAAPLLVTYMNVALVLRFDNKSERYFVCGVIFSDDNSPDPGGVTVIGERSAPLLSEKILNALNTKTVGYLDRRKNYLNNINRFIMELVTLSAALTAPPFASEPAFVLADMKSFRDYAGERRRVGDIRGTFCAADARPKDCLVVKSVDPFDPTLGFIVLDVTPRGRSRCSSPPTTS